MTESENRVNHRADTLFLQSLLVFDKEINMFPLAFFFFDFMNFFKNNKLEVNFIHLFVNSEQIVYYVDQYQ